MVIERIKFSLFLCVWVCKPVQASQRMTTDHFLSHLDSAEKTRKEAVSPSKRGGQKYEEDGHPRSRSRTGERDKARDKDWDAKGEVHCGNCRRGTY